jgi:hypothetical protein
MAMCDNFQEIFQRELMKLETEINSFRDETLIWKVQGNLKNSAGNLCLHLCGNLQHFIGSVLGNSGYIRNRDAEFSSKNISKQKLIEEIMNARNAIKNTFMKISDDDLPKIFKQDFLGKEVSTSYFLVHLISHFDYHLGQINYLRRVLETF